MAFMGLYKNGRTVSSRRYLLLIIVLIIIVVGCKSEQEKLSEIARTSPSEIIRIEAVGKLKDQKLIE